MTVSSSLRLAGVDSLEHSPAAAMPRLDSSLRLAGADALEDSPALMHWTRASDSPGGRRRCTRALAGADALDSPS